MKKLIYTSLFAVLALASCQNEAKKAEATDSVVIAAPPPPVASVDTLTPPPPPAEPQDKKVYEFVGMDQPPTYPGGMEAFYKFLGANLKYPATAIAKNVQGNVFLSFIIEEDGTVSNVKADNKLGSGTEEEAVRVLKLSKKWNPGKDKGVAVRTAYKLPVKFSLQK